MLWGLPQFHKKPKLNHVLTIFWVARITTLANNLCLEHIKPRIQTFPARFLCWRSWTYVFAPFCMDKCIFRKKLLCNLGARWHKILEFVPSCPTYGWLTWWCDFFPVGPTFEDHPQVPGQKKVQSLGLYFWHLRLGLFKSPFLVREAEHMCLHPFARTNVFSEKTTVLQFGRALTQNSWICPVMSYLWMIGLVMRLFSCGANLWRSSAGIRPKKGPAPWVLFLTPAPRPLQVTVSMFVKMNISIRALLQGQMYLQ